MPKGRPPTSGYARLAQEDEDTLEDSDRDEPHHTYATISTPGRQYAPIQPERRHDLMQQTSERSSPFPRRMRSNSGVDIKAINARLERWADEIASKFKFGRGKGKAPEEQLEIQHSVFQAPENIRPATAETLESGFSGWRDGRISRSKFEDISERVRVAIELDVHPLLISQGSSGSYFARDSDGTVVGVFKPKDEEPYASRNPKWTKWIHRNLFPFFFGRACLIPNLSYVSEAAAYILDEQLQCGLVPYTDIVPFSSKSFHYDYWDRRAFYRKKKPLPAKVGSFQIFLNGYKDATKFLKEHPWPDQQSPDFSADVARKKYKKRRRWFIEDCRPRGSLSDDEDDEEATAEDVDGRRVFWTDSLQQSFREQLERLVILDYIMRNTDRGLDNWMIRIDRQKEEAKIAIDPFRTDGEEGSLQEANGHISVKEPYRRQEQMIASSRSATPLNTVEEENAIVHIGAIDNSLSWPWKHPDAWRSYPFGWLFLPVSLIGQPFSEATRTHFLPLLTSKKWWSDTQSALRRCFMQDADFKEKMYAKQIAVMKGQAWNVVETLKTPYHGPLELTRRSRVYVWDDPVEVPVAVRMRSQSSELRRKKAPSMVAEEEVDISVAGLTRSQTDLLNFESSAAVEPSSSTGSGGAKQNRFNRSRQYSLDDVRDAHDQPDRTLSPPNFRAMNEASSSGAGGAADRSFANRPGLATNRSRLSLDERTRPRDLGMAMGRRQGILRSLRTHGTFHDDVEGDLGYAAAEGSEMNRKRVIVERLEPVKSKKPFFTWC